MTDERQTTGDEGDVDDIMASIRERVFAAAEEQERGETLEPFMLSQDFQVAEVAEDEVEEPLVLTNPILDDAPETAPDEGAESSHPVEVVDDAPEPSFEAVADDEEPTDGPEPGSAQDLDMAALLSSIEGAPETAPEPVDVGSDDLLASIRETVEPVATADEMTDPVEAVPDSPLEPEVSVDDAMAEAAEAEDPATAETMPEPDAVAPDAIPAPSSDLEQDLSVFDMNDVTEEPSAEDAPVALPISEDALREMVTSIIREQLEGGLREELAQDIAAKVRRDVAALLQG
ncbi:MAG: hypothetical protein AAFQ51_16390 [Pseudomonadota bacterium]